MLKIKTNLVLIILILLFSIIVSLPLLRPGLHLIHDDQHIARLYLFDQSLQDGQFPVRWVDELGFGYGYPLFNFYPPFVYMLGEAFHLLGFGFIDSVKLVFFISVVGSGVAMFILGKELWGRLAGLTSAMFYMVLPYRAVDVYVRGALAESFSFVWLPLVLWSFYKLYRRKSVKYILLAAAFLALLMITHNLIFLPFMLILPIYLLFLVSKSGDKRKFIIYCFLSVVFSLGLSAFFWIPAILEKKFTLVDQLLLTNLADFRIHFVYLQQLWNWTWGFGGSAQGLADGISFKIGKLHIVASIAAFILAVVLLIKSKKPSKLSIVNCQLSIVFITLFIFSAFMTTAYSKIIWELFPPLFYLQFPWRFLIFTGLFSSVLAGALIYLLRVAIFRLFAFIILTILLLLPNLKLFKPQNYRLDLTDEKATSKGVIAWEVSKTSFEYIPKGVELKKDESGNQLININKTELPMDKIDVVPKTTAIYNQEYSSSIIKFDMEASDRTVVKANIFSFPGWNLKVDGQAMPFSDNNLLKLITFEVSDGMHEVVLEFRGTFIRYFANFISFFTMLMIISSLIFLKLLKIKTKLRR